MAMESDRSTAPNDLKVQFDEHGLVPAIVQDWRDGAVLMLGYMNRESLDQTFQTGYVHFWSRSRRKLWKKGETSGHYLLCKRVFLDCDGDVLLVKAEPTGPTCHTEARTCFFAEVTPQGVTTTQVGEEANGGIFERLYEMVLERKAHPQEHSYVSSLMKDGPDRILKKVVEEAGEVVLAVKKEHREEIIHEVADLLFHSIVALGHSEIPMTAIQQELGKRFGQSGIRHTGPEPSR
jgi:phosphoribosyl-ATP pyrophosphohydrolase/phosphoribosyl-AMP cyclohydrolase